MTIDKNSKVCVLTLGCSKNVVDSENLIGILTDNKVEITNSLKSADTVIVNTCGFIGPSKQESIDVILQASELKKKGKIKNLIVYGCMIERYESELSSQLTEVDSFFGLNSDKQILELFVPDAKNYFYSHRNLLTPSHYAYVKISEGCNHECSFCAIPLIRGKYISRDFKDIENEIISLVMNGVKEFNLIAQDTTYYGRDIDGKSHLSELLERVSDIDGVEWIRLHYAYPTAFPVEVLKIIVSKSNICNYIDIPFQHISDNVLKSMRRGTDSKYIYKLIETIREIIPDVAIRSTFITGYPGETKVDFEQLQSFLEKIKLDRVGVFEYSHEEDTHAYSMIDTVPHRIKMERKEELMLTQQKISLENNRNKMNSLQRVIVDEINNGSGLGRTEHDAPDVDNLVHFKANKSVSPGDFINVLITNASEYDLYGKIV